MFNNSVKINYDGSDALGEIIVMLLGAFILGWIARWLWDAFFGYEVSEEYYAEQPLVAPSPAVPAQAPVAEPVATPTREIVSPNGLRHDDLKIVEGIGPKIEGLLKKSGINTWGDLAKTDVEHLRKILKDAGDRFTFHDPSTWPEQAALAYENKWSELEEFQDFLNGGRPV